MFYDRGPLALRVGGDYSGEFISTINPTTPEADTRTRARPSYQFYKPWVMAGVKIER